MSTEPDPRTPVFPPADPSDQAAPLTPDPTARYPQTQAERAQYPAEQYLTAAQYPSAQYPSAQYPTAQYPDPAGYPVYAQQYPGQPYHPQPYPFPPAGRGTNSMAIAAFVMLVVFPPLSIVLGTIAGRQIQRTGEEGGSFARFAVIGGIVLTVLGILAVVAMGLFFYSMADWLNDLEPR